VRTDQERKQGATSRLRTPDRRNEASALSQRDLRPACVEHSLQWPICRRRCWRAETRRRRPRSFMLWPAHRVSCATIRAGHRNPSTTRVRATDRELSGTQRTLSKLFANAAWAYRSPRPADSRARSHVGVSPWCGQDGVQPVRSGCWKNRPGKRVRRDPQSPSQAARGRPIEVQHCFG